MNLHEDKLAFLNIINLVHEDSGIRSDILEKDYYVTMILKLLAQVESWQASKQSCRLILKVEQLCIKHRKASVVFLRILI